MLYLPYDFRGPQNDCIIHVYRLSTIEYVVRYINTCRDIKTNYVSHNLLERLLALLWVILQNIMLRVLSHKQLLCIISFNVCSKQKVAKLLTSAEESTTTAIPLRQKKVKGSVGEHFNLSSHKRSG